MQYTENEKKVKKLPIIATTVQYYNYIHDRSILGINAESVV